MTTSLNPKSQPALATAPTFDAFRIAALVEALLGLDVVDARFIPRGFANENWHVRTVDGDVLVKVGRPGASASKWRASARALDLAQASGVSCPVLLHGEASCPALGGRVLRIQQWIDGVAPDSLEGEASVRFWTALGRAVRSLHDIPFDHFSSRLDDSAPDYPTWSGYLGYRIPQIEARCAQASMLSAAERRRLWDRVLAEARALDGVVTPSFVHRDLHLDNLLATPDGGLAGLLDFDMVEPWDPVGDWFKLTHWCFAGHDDRRRCFEAGYGEPGEQIPNFETRRAIIDVIEGLNLAANEGLSENAERLAWALAIVRDAFDE